MTKVLQVSKYYPPSIGGIERTVETLAEGLEATTRVISVNDSARTTTERRNGVTVRRVGSVGEVRSLPIAPTFPWHLRRDASEAALVHAHLPNPLALGSKPCWENEEGVTVATYHSDISRQKLSLLAYRPFLERYLSSLDGIMVTSPRLLEYSPMLRDIKDRCEVIPLGIDVDRFGGDRAIEATPPGDLEEGMPVVLFVGRLVYYKGLQYLLEAMTSVDAQLVIIGDGPLGGRLERIADNLGVANRVHFRNTVSESSLHAHYDVADVFVLPSIARSEAFGLVQLEAMAYETPVINTDLPTGVPWVSKHGQTGLTVPPADSEAITRALTRLLDDDERRQAYGQGGRERVETEFTREQLIERVEAWYRSLGGF